MAYKEMVMEAIKSLGYKPQLDEEGRVYIIFQMKTILFLQEDDEEPFFSAVLPRLSEVVEGEETLTLAVCNRVTRDIKLVKVFIDHSLKSVSASCDFFFTDMESLKANVNQVLNVYKIVRAAYYKTKAEYSEQ